VELAEALATAGASLVLLARRAPELERTGTRLRQDYGVEVHEIAADLSDRTAVQTAFEGIVSERGPIDILVNNAGTAPTGAADKQWPEDWDRTLELNLSAVFHCSLLAARSMRDSGRGGRIINIASIFGHLGSSLFRVSSYAASKGGLENLTRQLAVEWAADGITVNAIAPAWFPSEMTVGSLGKEGVAEKMSAACPMDRMGKPGELRTACLFLASPASSYVTGAVIPVDGGYSAW